LWEGDIVTAPIAGWRAVMPGERPPARCAAWRAPYPHQVFRDHGDSAAQLDPDQRGILGPPTRRLRDRIRQFVPRGHAR
jgi:hypothetical protein